MKGIFGFTAVRGRIGEWIDDLEKFHHRTGPAVCHEQRHCIGDG